MRPVYMPSWWVQIAEAAAIAHQAAGQGELTVWEDRGQRMAGRQRRKLFHATVEEGTVAEQDRTNALLRKSCEGRFEIAIGSGIPTRSCRPSMRAAGCRFCDDGWCIRIGRVRDDAEHGSIGHQFAEQLQSFRRQIGP